MPHTKTPKPCKRAKKSVKKAKKYNLWKIWFNKWKDQGFPGAGDSSSAFYGGLFKDIPVDPFEHHRFLMYELFPGIKRGYIHIEDDKGHELKHMPYDDDMDQEVVVYFRPENIIKKMHLYLRGDTLEQHYEALKQRGWVVKEPRTGKRNVFRS
jgi:hypothetical protein